MPYTKSRYSSISAFCIYAFSAVEDIFICAYCSKRYDFVEASFFRKIGAKQVAMGFDILCTKKKELSTFYDAGSMIAISVTLDILNEMRPILYIEHRGTQPYITPFVVK